MKKPIKLFDLRVTWIIWRNPFFTEPVFLVWDLFCETLEVCQRITSLLCSERLGFSQKLSLNHVNSTGAYWGGVWEVQELAAVKRT